MTLLLYLSLGITQAFVAPAWMLQTCNPKLAGSQAGRNVLLHPRNPRGYSTDRRPRTDRTGNMLSSMRASSSSKNFPISPKNEGAETMREMRMEGAIDAKIGKTLSASKQRWAERTISGVILPSQLKNYHNISHLIEALKPSVAAARRGELDGGSAAIAMNHLKRLGSSTADLGRAQGEDLFVCLRAYAKAVHNSAASMSSKHLSLAVNALAWHRDETSGVDASCREALRELMLPLALRITSTLIIEGSNQTRQGGNGGSTGARQVGTTSSVFVLLY